MFFYGRGVMIILVVGFCEVGVEEVVIEVFLFVVDVKVDYIFNV